MGRPKGASRMHFARLDGLHIRCSNVIGPCHYLRYIIENGLENNPAAQFAL